MRLDGYSKGVFDMVILTATQDAVNVYLIEFKYGKNKYTTEQQAVADACEDTPIEAIKIYSLEEFETFVKEKL